MRNLRPICLTIAGLAFGAHSTGAQRVPPLSESTVLEGAPGAEKAWPIPERVRVFFHRSRSVRSFGATPTFAWAIDSSASVPAR